MSIINTVQDLINEHGSSSILRERLLLLKDQLDQADREMSDLKKENANLRKQCMEARKELENQRQRQEFVEYKGALFKRDGANGYHDCPYCPSCKLPMGLIADIAPFNCKPCHRKTPFKGHEFPQILEELKNKQN